MMYSGSGASAGVGFAVPTATVRMIVPQLIESGRVRRPQMGVTLLPIRVSQRAGLAGVVIETVAPGSPAEDAGLSGLAASRGGDSVALVVERGGTRRDVAVELVER